jgi:hypothetical protein
MRCGQTYALVTNVSGQAEDATWLAEYSEAVNQQKVPMKSCLASGSRAAKRRPRAK